jgi:hypothetical protein
VFETRREIINDVTQHTNFETMFLKEIQKTSRTDTQARKHSKLCVYHHNFHTYIDPFHEISHLEICQRLVFPIFLGHELICEVDVDT